MRLSYDEETEAFRVELRGWLEEHAPRPEDSVERRESSAHMPGWARAWQRRLFDAGWLVPGWPPELGGRNATAIQQMVYFEELARCGVTRSANPQGLGIIAPSILDYGNAEQKERYALPTLRGDITWCVGMSEPDAGSDLASLSTTAVVDGDTFVVNGQKVWTSGAHHADYCFCFVRTDPNEPKHRGISVLIIDMKTPGVRCRPLPELTDPDYNDFNEVFFTDAVVPRENLVGELNKGWPMAMGSLAHERGMLWLMNAAGLDRSFERLLALAAQPDGPLDTEAVFRDRMAALYIDTQALRFMGYRGFAKTAKGETSSEHMLLKLFGSEVEQQLYLTAVEALGANALDVADDQGPENHFAGAWAPKYFRSFSGTIAGGTSEIQRNIIAERVLGLPRR
jgi:alkylation response protein AidB-like acyl-CoA dehydrogenase